MRIDRATDAGEIAKCLAIRRIVFIEGQDVSEAEEVDGKDPECRHYIGRIDGAAVATARVLPLGKTAKIQRVAVLDDFRGKNLGAGLMRYILSDLAPEFSEAVLGSQTHAIPFYEKLGFEAFGPIYDDAGIDHRDMRRPL